MARLTDKREGPSKQTLPTSWLSRHQALSRWALLLAGVSVSVFSAYWGLFYSNTGLRRSSFDGELPPSSAFPAITLSWLLTGEPHPPAAPSHESAPFACLVAVVVDGDTIRCIPVLTDAEVSIHFPAQQQPTLRPLLAALENLTTVYSNLRAPPQLTLPTVASSCSPISSCTLNVRLYAIDAPETRKRGIRKADPDSRGKEQAPEALPSMVYGSAFLDVGGQPLGVAAAAALADMVLGRVVLVVPLRLDQYKRILARVLLPAVTHRSTEGSMAFASYFHAVFTHIAAQAIPTDSEGQLVNKAPPKEAGQSAQRLVEALEAPYSQKETLHALAIAKDTLWKLRKPSGFSRPSKSSNSPDLEEGPRESGARVREACYLLQILEQSRIPLLFDVSDVLLRRGLSVLYTGGGRVYAGRRPQLEELQRTAERNKEGIWGLPIELRESPMEYKRRKKANSNKNNLPKRQQRT
ncbi:hypothetical protein cyc_07101 [Cyclospora cayetanensis]|uniref:TNase-like domain-containing protein n=1 Tax=Cyclospora cayetanensis TaxID=88456 RepID=A0A1D3CUN7_9EIME|nr:hypothetical protein cyc_07101 [Cyclospora cayetanensis]